MKYTLALMLLLIPLASAATLEGNVYDFSLDPVEALVEINTSPSQKMVAKEFYSFEVPEGTYLLTAKQIVDGLVEATVEEVVTVESEGIFVRDLILFESFFLEDDDIKVEDIEINTPVKAKDNKSENQILSWIIFIALLLIAFAIYKLTNHDPHEKAHPELDSEAQKVYKFISKKKRTTQKEIRKEFPHSEAKISLIVAELEEKQLVKKIKKGRGNIIIKN